MGQKKTESIIYVYIGIHNYNLLYEIEKTIINVDL